MSSNVSVFSVGSQQRCLRRFNKISSESTYFTISQGRKGEGKKPGSFLNDCKFYSKFLINLFDDLGTYRKFV